MLKVYQLPLSSVFVGGRGGGKDDRPSDDRPFYRPVPLVLKDLGALKPRAAEETQRLQTSNPETPKSPEEPNGTGS